MKKCFIIFVTLFFAVSCGTVPVDFATEQNPENLLALTVLPLLKVPLELPSRISPDENPWVDLSVEIGSNLKPTNMKYVNSSHPKSTALINNAFKSAKYWAYSPKNLKYIEGKRYLLRINNFESQIRNKNPIPVESVYPSMLDRPEVYSVFKHHSASKYSSGVFIFEVTIDTNGGIKKSKIIKSELNSPTLESALLETVNQIKISPYFGFSQSKNTSIVHTYEFPLLSSTKESASPFALRLENFAFTKVSKDIKFQAGKKQCISEFPEDSGLYTKKYSNWKMTNSFAVSSSQEVLDEISFYNTKRAEIYLNMAVHIEQSLHRYFQTKDKLTKLNFCKALIIHMESAFD